MKIPSKEKIVNWLLQSYTMKDAFESYKDCINISQDMFNRTFKLIEFFKTKNSLQKVFGDNDWYNMETKEILLSLKDFHKLDFKDFEISSEDDTYIKELINLYSSGFFESIKKNCNFNFETFDMSFVSTVTEFTAV